ncbi:uncharacterized protein RJT20DRAFT_137511 [Scheffersomyces xylosifermentans]|uniref:uncharacterized protein n=1 Tax=Scheffersomyces xylosifermentans TaxID=1304137 RepID=UPI00315D0979
MHIEKRRNALNLDTGSWDSWVIGVGASCFGKSDPDLCHHSGLYNISTSTSSKDLGIKSGVGYQYGTLTYGIYAIDDFSFVNGPTLRQFEFIISYNCSVTNAILAVSPYPYPAQFYENRNEDDQLSHRSGVTTNMVWHL